MFNAVGKGGITRTERTNLERMAGWDNCEMMTIGASNVDLTSGVLGDGGSGVGDGKSRANYYAYGIHNPSTSSAVATVHTNEKGGATKNYTVTTPAGGWSMPLVRMTSIKGTGSGSTAGQIMVLYKDKYAVDETGTVQSITE